MSTSIELPDKSPAFDNFKNGNETAVTYSLKWAAWKWLWEVAECRVVGFEVRLEGPFGRIADVVGLGPENRVFLIEVKSSRSDLQRDDNNDRTQKKLRQKAKSLDEAEELTRTVLAEARVARADADTATHSRVVEMARSDVQVISKKSESTKKRIETLSTKFHDPAYLRCADYHYIMTPDRMIRTTELPEQWGLLNESAEMVVEAPFKQVKRVTQHVLRAIARANTRDLMKACEVDVQREPV
ncbi:MAG TPA: hypothetical protein EYQ61_09830 [Dehalococcoidia bacterium]|jgi:hypothetical protein|nr:hypothetical protein [Dehalococcoidia bacterium]HIK88089.1 hypothetical protein [Dehalococcoidia bacterium]